MKEQQLNELSIFALRELARRTGVNSPTSKKKQQLIEEIVNITEGKQEPSFPSTKQGRPPKGFIANFGDILSDNENAYSKNLVFNQETGITDEEPRVIDAYVEVLSANVAFLWIKSEQSFEKFFISTNLIVNANLKTGDYINAEVFQKEGQTVLSKIFTVNGKNSLVERRDFKTIPAKLPNKPIVFTKGMFVNTELEFGENIFLYGSNNRQNTLYVVDMLNEINSAVKIYINLSLIEKNKLYLEGLHNAEQFTANLTDEMDYSRKMVYLATERALRMAEQGENVFMVVDDVLSLISIDQSDLELTRKLISLTKNTESGSITIVSVMPMNREINILENLADKKVLLTKNGIEQI